MLDAAFIRDHLDAVKANCKNRNVRADVDRVVALDDERKRLIQQAQVLQQRANEVPKLISGTKDQARRQELIAEGRSLREQVAALEKQKKQVEEDLHTALMTIPNMTHPDAPVGTTAEDNKVIRRWGEPRKFDFTPRDHVALAESLDLVDFEAGASVAGQKFYYFKNEAALLELALVQYAMQTLVREGYTPVITPDVARVEVLEGIGFIPRDPDPEKRQVYALSDTDLCLIATAEITLGGMHKDRIFEQTDLPRRYVGLSHCFRTEAGAPGRDARGLYRVHQFTKVEMFVFCTPEKSEQYHQELLAIEEMVFRGLGLPYHVIDTCTGDLGGPAYRKYDLEAWMPGRGQGGEYGEVTSTSNCTDYQARRLGIRYRPEGQKGTRFVHTLNGTAVAVTRALLAILENYQEADGSVTIPEVLRPWVGKDRITQPVVTGVSPNTGPSTGNTIVIITGSGFTGAMGVAFGRTAAPSFTVDSDTQVRAVSPPHAAGTVDVRVGTNGRLSAAAQGDQFLYTAAVPAVLSVFPGNGPTRGGTQVTITGTNFTGATGVTFGGISASFTVNSSTQITAVSPAHAAGTVDVQVITPNGTSAPAAGDQFLYAAVLPAVTGLSPNNGPAAGGTFVNITGTNFTGATGVAFGGTAASSFTVSSATQITAISPAHAAGQVDVQVGSPDGPSAVCAADKFTYT